ncbi:hypothetical protein QA633_08485 [Bradyrhizobium barranii]|uniref:hypothetical protein n=1 Tax=Bradyrhizobium barranii TaxID=2992140 RepID=UPI0024B24436|nr:hypothetical protein [Bradyrhizobium barranii]WFT97064.1 hypothetical protein QA633_08485 [Bradyrhizobium barranii]
MLGALGAVTATAPAEALLIWIGWRGPFELLAASSTTAAAVILFFGSRAEGKYKEPLEGQSVRRPSIRLGGSGELRRILQGIGSARVLQSLSVASCLSYVEGLDRTSLITQLLIMATALSIGALLLDAVTDSRRRPGKNIEHVARDHSCWVHCSRTRADLASTFPVATSWIIVAVVGSAIALSYAIIADYFPAESIARANGVLTLLHFGWAFPVQYERG